MSKIECRFCRLAIKGMVTDKHETVTPWTVTPEGTWVTTIRCTVCKGTIDLIEGEPTDIK